MTDSPRAGGPAGEIGDAWLGALIHDVEEALGRHAWRDNIPEIRRVLAEALDGAAMPTPATRAVAAGGFHRKVLHAQASPALSIIAVTASPGAATPVHDHVAWCVMGVQQGRLESTRYRLDTRGGESRPIEQETVRLCTGDAIVLLPPHDDIHSVRCAGPGPAVAVHIFGADLSGGRPAAARLFGPVASEPARAGRPSAGRWLTRAAVESRERF